MNEMLLPPEVAANIDQLPYVFDTACSEAELEAKSPWSHGRAHPPIYHIVPPGRTRNELMQEALRRVRMAATEDATWSKIKTEPETSGQETVLTREELGELIEQISVALDAETQLERDERNRAFMNMARPSSSEDMYPITPLPPDWPATQTPPLAVLVNSVYNTLCGNKEGIGGNSRYGGLSFVGMQQQLLEFMVPFHVPPQGVIHGPLFRFKIRPRERATHRFNPMTTSFQSVGVASDMVGTLTGHIMTQLIATAMGLKHFRTRRTRCYNRVYTIFFSFLVNAAAFVAANRHLVDEATKFHKVTVARSPDVKSESVCLLIFPSGVCVCVGATHTEEMLQSMRYFLPLLYQARMPSNIAQTIPRAGSKKRKRTTGDLESPPKRKRITVI